ncbi:MAG: hypothetical protein IJU19_07130 [Bacteroidales bacterium]|nr:hypothetical protein [Bacteroidales bacterium]
MRIRLLLAVIVLSLSLAACGDDDFTPPSFLHLDGITTYIPTTGALSADSGFYRSDIVAAYVVAHYPGASKVDTLGLYRLPFTIPVLYSGAVDYINIYPAIEQSGISGALPFYTFYNPIQHKGVSLTSGDTLNLGLDSTTYNSLTDAPHLFEPFELPTDTIRLTPPLEWKRSDPAGACTGLGYGLLHVDASESVVDFSIEDIFYIPDPTKIVYLELDVRSDLPLQVYMKASYYENSSDDLVSVMTINPISHWQHLYINLGRTWSYFNHPSTFRLQFRAVNENGLGGDISLDNVKLLTTSVAL